MVKLGRPPQSAQMRDLVPVIQHAGGCEGGQHGAGNGQRGAQSVPGAVVSGVMSLHDFNFERPWF